MRFIKLIIAGWLLFFCCLHAHAQDSDYVFKDSSVTNADSIAAKLLAVDAAKKNSVASNAADSSARDKPFSNVSDSAEVLKGASYFAYAKNMDSILKAIQKQQALRQAENTSSSWLESFFSSSLTKLFFWLLGIFFILFILYKLFFTAGIFQRQSTKSNVLAAPDKEEDLSATADYNKLIAQAAANKNYRLAIRYYYLQGLQKLAVQNAIQFTADKTNHQYITELFDKPYKSAFAALTLTYEYAWYGSFVIDEELFTKIENNFKAFYNSF